MKLKDSSGLYLFSARLFLLTSVARVRKLYSKDQNNLKKVEHKLGIL